MSDWNLQQKRNEERRARDRSRREKLVVYFYDLSKLCFTGMVAGIVLPLISDNENKAMWAVAVFGICLTILSAMLANKILK